MAAHYFICDVHLGLQEAAVERAKERRLLTLLEQVAEQGSGLYILGDLFDFWFEYRHVVPIRNVALLSALRGLTESGRPVHYLAGNHDFAPGPYLADHIGCVLHPEPFSLELEGQRLMLHHGDGLVAGDFGYRVLKRVLRSRWSQRLWRLLHPDWAIGLAERVSRTSRRHTGARDYGPDDRLYSAVDAWGRQGYDWVIMGHTHTPDARPLPGGGHYLNLGCWLDGGTPHARLEAGRLTVVAPDGSVGHYRCGGASMRP